MEIMGDDGYLCNRCLDENEQNWDSLVELERSILSENRLASVYITGCVQMKAGSEIVDDTNLYYETYGDFFAYYSSFILQSRERCFVSLFL